MNVLAISYGKNFFTPGNPERERMLACAREVEQLHIVVFTDAADGFTKEVIEDKLFIYPTNSTFGIGKVIDALLIGSKILKQQKEREWVVTAQDPFEAGLVGWVVARLKGAPLNIQEHGDFYSGPHWRAERRLNKIRFWYGKYLLRAADLVRVVSRRTKDTLIGLGVASDRILELSVATDIDKFLDAQPDNSCVPDFHEDHVYLLTVARFVPQKNLELLINSYRTIARQFPKTRLLIVGQGPLKNTLKQIAGDSPQIQFMPWCEDVPTLMATADLYVLSSNYEGWGRVLVEAQAAGLPIVTTDVGCVGEVVLAGEGALVVPVADQTAYTIALERALKQLPQLKTVAQTKRNELAQSAPVDAYATQWKQVLEATHAIAV